MTIKQINVNQGYPVIKKLMDLPMKPSLASKLYSLERELRDHFAFAQEEEKKLFEKYGAIGTEDGSIRFNDENNAKAWNEEFIEFLGIEIDIRLKNPIEIPAEILDEMPCSITASELSRVEAFIKITIPEEPDSMEIKED